jgi:hypothetical protein
VSVPVGVGFGIRDAAPPGRSAAWPTRWSSAAASSRMIEPAARGSGAGAAAFLRDIRAALDA